MYLYQWRTSGDSSIMCNRKGSKRKTIGVMRRKWSRRRTMDMETFKSFKRQRQMEKHEHDRILREIYSRRIAYLESKAKDNKLIQLHLDRIKKKQ